MSARDRQHRGRVVFFGGLAGPVLLLFGLQIASAASVSMWLNLELVASAALGRLFFRDQPGRFVWRGVAGIVAAGALLSTGEGRTGSGRDYWLALPVPAEGRRSGMARESVNRPLTPTVKHTIWQPR